jgi:hypothetical protein
VRDSLDERLKAGSIFPSLFFEYGMENLKIWNKGKPTFGAFEFLN